MITLHVGKLGVGKSYDATRRVWKTVKNGKDAYVNWKIDFTELYLHTRTGWRGLLWKIWAKVTFANEKMGKVYYWKELKDLYSIANGELFYDEAHQELNARSWEKIPPDFVRKLTQSRKYGLNMHFISQHSGQVDVIVRRLSNDFIVHKKYWKVFFWKEYDGEKIEILANPVAAEMSKPKSQGFGFYLFSKKLANSYDTFALFDPFDKFDGKPMWDAEQALIDRKLKKLKNKNDQVKRNTKKPFEELSQEPVFDLLWSKDSGQVDVREKVSNGIKVTTRTISP